MHMIAEMWSVFWHTVSLMIAFVVAVAAMVCLCNRRPRR
jgi:hypothetical protein